MNVNNQVFVLLKSSSNMFDIYDLKSCSVKETERKIEQKPAKANESQEDRKSHQQDVAYSTNRNFCLPGWVDSRKGGQAC